LFRRLRSLIDGRNRDADLEEELRFHIDMTAARNRAQGMDDDSAQAHATQSFGGVLQHREDAHDSRGVRRVEDFLQDVRFGLRALARQRVFTVVAVATLAIGIGGTTAIFGAVYSVLLAPLPYPDADRIVTLWETSQGNPDERNAVSPGNFLDWQERARSFSMMAAIEPYSLDYVGADGPERFQTSLVTKDFFSILAAPPLLGRLFQPEEFTAGRSRVVVLSERIWQSRFGGDSTIIGRALVLDSVPTTVIGVVGTDVEMVRSEHLWMPKVFRADEREDRTSAYYSIGARLKPGVSLEASQREMATLAHELAVAHGGPTSKGSALVLPLTDVILGDARRPLLLLLGAVGFVLLVSCSNVANLQLAQTVRRGRELAIRAALGAGRGRLVRQLLAESIVLALIGGAAGVAVAYLGVGAIRALAPADLPRVEEIGLSTPLLLFSLALSVLTAMLFGTIPMIEAGRAQRGESLVGGGERSGTGSRARRRTQRALVGTEIALAMVLLVGAGLLARSFNSLLRVERGYDTTGVTNVTLQAWSYYPTPQARTAFVDEAVSRLQAIPGVTSAGMTSSLPLSVPIGMERTSALIEGQPRVAPGEQPSIRVASTSSGYFATMQNPVRRGRVFDGSDRSGSIPVVVVNEALARRYWPGGDAIGKRVTFGFMSRPVERTVVGVVADMRHEGLAADPEPMAFIPHAQASSGAMQFVIRAAMPANEAQQAVRRELSALNGAMPLSEVTSLEARLADSLRERRFQLSMLVAFSVTALLLAAIGIYGMMSYMTTERTKEIGVRIAVGALPADVVRMVMRQGVALTAISMVVGLAGAVALTRLMTGMLFGVGAMDPLTYVAAALALFAVAGLASWIPARRAASIDPLVALRSE